MSGPSVYFDLPPWDLFKFPPTSLPRTLPPPVNERTLRAPFGIDPWIFNVAMKWQVPFTFAFTYIFIVLSLNSYNRSHGNKPWRISRQRWWKGFVVLHNVVLAVYSLATFVAMYKAITNTWPGFDNPNGPAGVADALCKIHGPRGLGDAVTYNTTINIWESKNSLIKLANRGANPDPTDVGRLWNEGLAFWGWIFYLSKFYEVVDTFIIIAKGKRSPTLQTYHHAGAMLCMWAGMRYMSPPIWMFVFINSAIHAMMYTYFTCTALNIRVPNTIKRTLTTMQIAQFLFGATFAAVHLFVSYDIPIATPYKVASAVSAAAASATSAVTSATSVVSEVIETPTAAANFGNLVKKLLLRAAGEEGVAERVALPHDRPIAQAVEQKLEQVHHAPWKPTYETRWRTDWTKVHCIDTTGEAFAIYLNLLYLFPLTILFARFFVKAYIQRGRKQRANSASSLAKQTIGDAKKAERETERAIEDAGKRAEDAVRHRGSDVKQQVDHLKEQLKKDVKDFRENGGRKVSDRIQTFEKQVKSAADKAKDQVTGTSSPRGTPRKSSPADKTADRQTGEQEAKKEPKSEAADRQSDEHEAKKEPKNDGTANDKPTSHGKENGNPKNPQQEKSGKDESEQKPQEDGEQQQDEGADDENKENDAPTAETKKVPAQDEPEQKQDDNIDESQAVRPGAEEPSGPTAEDDEGNDGEAAKDDEPAKDNQAEKVDEKDSEKPTAETKKVPAQDESASKQDANLDHIFIRPSPDNAESSDAMGQSGSIIDMNKYADKDGEDDDDEDEDEPSSSS